MNATAPAPIASTTVAPPLPRIAQTTISFADIAWVLIAGAALVAIVTFFFARARAKRDEVEAAANARAETLMNAIRQSHDDSARDLRELSDKVKEGRTVIEKDIEAIRADRRHDKANQQTIADGLKSLIDRNASDVKDLHTRVTTQEEKTRNQDRAIDELKTLMREKIDETKELIKSQGETSTAQFKELATTIREMSTRTPGK